MPRRLSFAPNVEIAGGSVLALITSINHPQLESILAKHGLTDVQADQWYPLQLTLDIIGEVAEGVNASENLVSIGMAAAELGIQRLPPEKLALSVEAILRAYGEEIYPSRHRGGDVGKIEVERVDETHLIIRARVPYPDEQIYGIMYGYARHFRPRGKHVFLSFDESARHDFGAPETIIYVAVEG